MNISDLQNCFIRLANCVKTTFPSEQLPKEDMENSKAKAVCTAEIKDQVFAHEGRKLKK